MAESRRLNRRDDDDDNLGSLAQAARGEQLKSARNILYFVAGWLMVSLVVEWVTFNNELKKLGAGVPEWALREAYQIMYVVTGGYVFLSILYVVFGINLKKYPVPITITSLVLFVALLLGVAALEPSTLAKGVVLKIIVIVGLVKGIQAAIAYEAERKASRAGADDDDELEAVAEEEPDAEPAPRRKAKPERDDW